MDPRSSPEVLREQRAYYAARASEYDDAYERVGAHDRGAESNAQWRAEFARLLDAFDQVPLTGDVVELAAGTGFWTERLARRIDSLTAIDANAETLAVNRRRLGAAAAAVNYELIDLFDWRPARSWDACVFCFWFCHVPDALVARFLNTVAESIRPGGGVCFVDKATSVDSPADLVDRTIGDGRRFRIVDQSRSPETLVDLFATAGLAIEIQTLGSRFCLGQGIRVSDAG